MWLLFRAELRRDDGRVSFFESCCGFKLLQNFMDAIPLNYFSLSKSELL